MVVQPNRDAVMTERMHAIQCHTGKKPLRYMDHYKSSPLALFFDAKYKVHTKDERNSPRITYVRTFTLMGYLHKENVRITKTSF